MAHFLALSLRLSSPGAHDRLRVPEHTQKSQEIIIRHSSKGKGITIVIHTFQCGRLLFSVFPASLSLFSLHLASLNIFTRRYLFYFPLACINTFFFTIPLFPVFHISFHSIG